MNWSRRDLDPVDRNAPRSTRPGVIIVSDVLLYRHGLAASLERDGRVDVIAAIGAPDARVALATHSPDALLLDASAEHGLALARQLRSSYPALRLVGFGISGGAASLIACAESGLSAFVDRNGTVSVLVSAILSAIKGELNCSPRIAALICDRLASLAGIKAEASEPLTRREREVAALVAEGLSNKEIAIDLRIGPATVKNHVHNILDKLNVPRRAAIPARLREAARAAAGAREPDLALGDLA
jgi:two-component system nitrate/nitrite response regulator NarL